MNNFKVLSYTLTPGQKILGYVLVRYFTLYDPQKQIWSGGCTFAYQVKPSQNGQPFVTFPSFKESADPSAKDWIQAVVFDSKSEEDAIKKAVYQIIHDHPNGYAPNSQYNQSVTIFGAPAMSTHTPTPQVAPQALKSPPVNEAPAAYYDNPPF